MTKDASRWPIGPPLLGLLAIVWTAFAPARAAAELRCGSVPDIVGAYLQHHVHYDRLGPEIRQRTVDAYLRGVDPSRVLLLEAHAVAARGRLEDIFERIRKGDCSRLAELQRELVDASRRAQAFVRSVAEAEGYAIDTSATLVLDPDERGYPANEDEREALLRSLIHFTVSNYVSAGTPLEEARERITHRYELQSKRLADVDEKDLLAAFLDAFASSLDPHSDYQTAEEQEDFRIHMSLSLTGIGVALSEQDGYAVAERIIPGGAADRHNGIKAKDKIIAVAQEDEKWVDIIDMPLREAVALIRGEKGTHVHLMILRQGERTERFPITIVRDKIDLAEQAARLRFEKRKANGRPIKLAVLELPSFYGDADPKRRQSANDVAKLLRQVQGEEADGLLLDLSRNGGGLLPHAVTISGFFLREGEIVGIANGRGQRQTLSDENDAILYSGPLVVHTSRASASAAEIVAGALQDYRRAVITGDDHTFGKGTVQTVAEYPPGRNDGALKITTALFFRPGGRSTQHGGVEADVVIPSLLGREDVGEQYQRYSLPTQKITPFIGDSANAAAPAQRWRPVSSQTLAALRERSRARVAASEEFAEVHEKLEELASNDGVIRLEELMKQREEDRENGDEDSTAQEKENPMNDSPQLQEALNVLSDLVNFAP